MLVGLQSDIPNLSRIYLLYASWEMVSVPCSQSLLIFIPKISDAGPMSVILKRFCNFFLTIDMDSELLPARRRSSTSRVR